MTQVVLLVGTRKGCFVLESDADRRDWDVRGPFCEGWPIYNAVHDPTSGALYAAAASEWHGAGVWRSNDLGETWTLSSEGFVHADPELKLSKITGLTAAHGRLLAGTEAAGIFESRTAARAGRSSAPSTASPAATTGTIPAKQPPGHLGLAAILPHPDDASRFWVVVQGYGIFETTDGGASWTPRNRGLRADWPLENPEVGYCVHKLVMSPVDHERLYQQNHCGMHRSDDGGHTWSEITEGLPSDFGFAAAAHPHDRESFYVIPLDPGPRALHARGSRRRLAHERRAAPHGSGSIAACPQRDAHLGVLREGMAIDSLDARPLLRHEHGTGLRERRRGRELERDRGLPAGDLVGRRRGARIAMADIHLPADAAAAVPRAAAPARRRRRERRRGDRAARRALARVPRPALRARAGAAPAHQRLRRPRARRARDAARRRTRGST